MSEILELSSVRQSAKRKTCNFCGVVKRTPADLKRHIRMHTGEKPFNCTECGKAFKAKRTAQIHKYVHHGICSDGTNISNRFKPERLQLLKKSRERNFIGFNDSNNDINEILEYREDSESLTNGPDLSNTVDETDKESDSDKTPEFSSQIAVRMFRCESCGKIFHKKGDLERHGRVHTGEKPYCCSLCQCQFKAYSTLKYHLRRDHNMPVSLSKSWEQRFQKLQHGKKNGFSEQNSRSEWYQESTMIGNAYTPKIEKQPTFAEYEIFFKKKMAENPYMNISFMGKMGYSVPEQDEWHERDHSLSLVPTRGLITELKFYGPNGPQIVFSCEICQTIFSSISVCTLHITEHCKDQTFSEYASSLSDVIIKIGTQFRKNYNL